MVYVQSMNVQMLVLLKAQFLALCYYINDLCKSTTMFDVFMYDDDTTLICDIQLENQSTVVNLELEKVTG